MRFPNIPNISPTISITRVQTIDLLLGSIAMEELALSHFINAEAEEIQYVLGTLGAPTILITPSMENLIKVNESVQNSLQLVL